MRDTSRKNVTQATSVFNCKYPKESQLIDDFMAELQHKAGKYATSMTCFLVTESSLAFAMQLYEDDCPKK